MSRRAKIAGLPEDVRKKLDAELVKRGFSGYDALETWLHGLGIAISKSSIHRYGTNLQRRLSAIKASTEAARLIAQEAPDDAGEREAAVISMISADVFEVIVQLQELDDPEVDALKRTEVLSKLAKNWATLTRASVALKRHQAEVGAKVRAAADKFERDAKKGGLSSKTVESIKRDILGIAK